MADNVEAPAGGGGATIRTDELPGAVHVAASKILLGADGVDGGWVATGNGLPVADRYTAGQVLADVTGNGASQTFTFGATMNLIWVRCDGGEGRADPFGGTPTASAGIYCDDGVPNPLTVDASSIKVFASAAVTIRVWGYRY